MAGPWFLFLVPWFLQLLPRGHPLISWLKWTVGLEFLGTMELWQLERQFLVRLPSPAHYTDRRQRYITQYFCEGGLFACPGASA